MCANSSSLGSRDQLSLNLSDEMEMIIEQRVVRPASPLPLKRENQFSSSLLITFKSEPQKLNICERKGNSKLSRNAILLFPYPSSKQSFDAKLSLFSLSAQALLLLLLIDYKNAIMSTKRGLAATIINCTQSRTKTGIEEHRKKNLNFKVHYDAQLLLKSQNDFFRGSEK